MVYRASLGSDVVRAERNRRLTQTDWTQSADAPLSTGWRRAYARYRQALRDMDMTPPAKWPTTPSGPEDEISPELQAMVQPGESPLIAAKRLLEELDQLEGMSIDKVELTPENQRRLAELRGLLRELREVYRDP